jgi:hypothetical protein
MPLTPTLKLRERLLALLDEGKPSPVNTPVIVCEQSTEPATVQPVVVVEGASTTAPGACSKCGSTLFILVGGGGKRCQGCGAQSNVVHANGISRRNMDSYEGGRAHFQPKGFAIALARMVGLSRR